VMMIGMAKTTSSEDTILHQGRQSDDTDTKACEGRHISVPVKEARKSLQEYLKSKQTINVLRVNDTKNLSGPWGDDITDTAHNHHEPSELYPFLTKVKISFYGIPMGITSQAMVWKALVDSPTQNWANIPEWSLYLVWIFGCVVYVVMNFLILAKYYFHSGTIMREAAHRVRSNFFICPALSLFFLILGAPKDVISMLRRKDEDETHAVPQWCAGICGCIMLAWNLRQYWAWIFARGSSVQLSNPAYQISLVGNFIVATCLGKAALLGPARFFIAIGIVSWTLVFITLFQDAQKGEERAWLLPKNLSPLLILFIAPPSAASVGFAAAMEGPAVPMGFDIFPQMMFYFSAFLFLFVLSNIRNLIIPVTPAFWAYTFPLAAFALATNTFVVHEGESSEWYEVGQGTAFGFFMLSAACNVSIGMWTLWKLCRGDLFQCDPLCMVCLEDHPEKPATALSS